MKRKSRVSHQLTAFLLAVAMFTSMCALMSPVALAANDFTIESEDNTTVDFVLLLDCSTSMPETDNHGLCSTACKMFLDMLPLENARVAVIAFGSKSVGTEYTLQSRSYKHAGDKRYIRQIIPLTDVKTIRDNGIDELKTRIESILQPPRNSEEAVVRKNEDKASPVGAAAVAAVDLLENSEAAEGRACILFLTDGISMSENGNFYLDYEMQPEAGTWAGSHNWPIYALQINTGGSLEVSYIDRMKDTANNSHPGKEADSTYFFLDEFEAGSKQIANVFLKVFDHFLGSKGSISEEKIGGNGKREYTFSIGEFTSEATIVAAGVGIHEIHLTKPGSEKELALSPGNHEEEGYILSIEEGSNEKGKEKGGYICTKLICPEPGDWKAEFYGDDNAEFIVYQCSMNDVNLQLSCSIDDLSKALDKKEKIDLTAKYVYHGGTVRASEELIDQMRPVLYAINVNNKEADPLLLNDVVMVQHQMVTADLAESAGWYYTASISMEYLLSKFNEEKGSYILFARVDEKEDDDPKLFRDGFKKSNELGPFKTESEDIQPTDGTTWPIKLPNQFGYINMAVKLPNQDDQAECETLSNLDDYVDKIEVDKYIISPDGDELKYDLCLENDRNQKIPFRVDAYHYLYITECPSELGNYDIALYAEDPNPSYPEHKIATFTLVVAEHHFSYDDIEPITLKIKPMFFQEEGPTEQGYDLAEYYSDPDGMHPIFSNMVLGESDAGIIAASFDESNNHLSIKALDSGNEKICFTVSDGFTEKDVVISVHVISLTALWWSENLIWVILICVVLILIGLGIIVLLIKKQVKGEWDFDLNNGAAQAFNVNINTIVDSNSKTLGKHHKRFPIKELVNGVAELMDEPGADTDAINKMKECFSTDEAASKLKITGVVGKNGFVLLNIPKTGVTVTHNTSAKTKKVSVLSGTLCIDDGTTKLTICPAQNKAYDDDYF